MARGTGSLIGEVNDLREFKRSVIPTIQQHIPSLSDADERVMDGRRAFDGTDYTTDLADLALRTCACGAPIDGYYQYVDHLIAVFGGESHYGG